MPTALDHRTGPCDQAATREVCNPTAEVYTCAAYRCGMTVADDGDHCRACRLPARRAPRPVRHRRSRRRRLTMAMICATPHRNGVAEGLFCVDCETEVSSRVALDWRVDVFAEGS